MIAPYTVDHNKFSLKQALELPLQSETSENKIKTKI